ncbi:phosphotransferase [Actinopolymorpha pittospori]|uniref:Aminoglycoside phosphotransferase (APT) family kinase protein n=1 Tax=Actinopolymorpha pittospori TaxID=648752 RepID=A0A927RBI3_9ACTN|nr:aminoglycoside phosphotransferase (APT) family kinase protein [Actinopolymorpha pittospori]
MTRLPQGADRPSPPSEVLARWALRVEGYLGGRANLHWRVSRDGRPLVLRRYQDKPLGDIGYELQVLQRLDALGWPVPVAVDGPLVVDGRTWCLFARLPGAPPVVTESPSELRAVGRLLARLHADLETLADLGQRPGCERAERIVADPVLTRRLREYERFFPESARILRWHADRAREAFDALDLRDRLLMVIHGDFGLPNLLCRDGRLTGVVDFEATHLNHRVSDFALAWRAKRDEVVRGYDGVRPLDELDWALITPALWSWVFLGVADEIHEMAVGSIQPHGFEWQVGVLRRRTPLMGMAGATCPDFPG